MIPADLPNATTVFERIAREDEESTAANRLRASRVQAVAREEAEALAEYARLAEANKEGRLVRETHGYDASGRPTIEREPDTKRLKAADAKIKAIRRKKEAIDGDAAQTPRLTAKRIELELAKLGPRATFVEVDRPRLPLGKTERAVDALPRFEAASRELIEEIATVETAARTFKEAEKAAHREIDRIADSGLPKSMRMFRGDVGIEWPTHEIQNPGFARVPDGLAVVAYLIRVKLKAEVSSLLKINANAFPDALSAEEKAARLAELRAQLDTAERIEAACVEQIIAEGGTAHYRPDISVLAVLSLRIAD